MASAKTHRRKTIENNKPVTKSERSKTRFKQREEKEARLAKPLNSRGDSPNKRKSVTRRKAR